uniref:Amino acid transporter n=1 Tax=Angiostrongylus cantonensis TaxID=6313 RepID=A0A0K0DLC2_ANGCA
MVSTVLGCGVMPPGQASTREFILNGFTLPTAMVFSTTAGVRARVPDIATSMAGAQASVSRIVMQAVIDVLERQGRSAGLSDDIIAIILGQLTVQINYTPLECKEVAVNQNPAMAFMRGMMIPHCIIVGSTVTSLCTGDMADVMCDINMNMNIGAIPAMHLSIFGRLTTTNVIMANWSREMWQSVVNRAVRMLASGPFGSNFFAAVATVA